MCAFDGAVLEAQEMKAAFRVRPSIPMCSFTEMGRPWRGPSGLWCLER